MIAKIKATTPPGEQLAQLGTSAGSGSCDRAAIGDSRAVTIVIADGTGYPAESLSGGALLGINARFAHARDFQPAGTGAGDGSENAVKPRGGLVRVKYAPSGVDPEKLAGVDLQVFKRALRWQRLRGVQHMLNMGNDSERVVKCYRVRYKPGVDVWMSKAWKRAHYKNLIVCASVWSCPVCSAKITERRKIELQNAPRINDFGKFMVTYTLRHNRGDSLKALYNDLAEGVRDMKHSRQYKNFVDRWRIVGAVTGTEVTVSNANGWHPHKHALMFSELSQGEIDANDIREELSRLFITAMQKRGRYVHAKIGVNVQVEHVIASYVAKMGEGEKWSLAAEIAKSPVKTGRGEDHFHPFELLDMYLARNIHAGKMFIEYAISMKGKKQLVYTAGLRELLGMNTELTDQEVAERVDDDANLFAQITADQWRVILKHEKRGQLLEVASTGNYALFVAWMRAVGCVDFGI